MFKAIVFDFDGVFIDTELLKTQSYYRMLSDPEGPYAGNVDVGEQEYLAEHPVGQGRKDVCEWILRRFGIEEDAKGRAEDIQRCHREGGEGFEAELYRAILDDYEPKGEWATWKGIAFDRGRLYEHMKNDAPAISTTIELLGAARQAGLSVGLVTRTGRDVTLKHLKRIGLAPDVFGAMVCEGDADVLGLNKDEFYRSACTKLGVSPENAVAVEDTDTGVGSAHKAGMGFIVAAPTLLTRRQNFIAQGADIVVADLSVLRSGAFQEWVSRLATNAK
jgi:beta-phosphoglucomutase-like phosphatase (HAD superfamily)